MLRKWYRGRLDTLVQRNTTRGYSPCTLDSTLIHTYHVHMWIALKPGAVQWVLQLAHLQAAYYMLISSCSQGQLNEVKPVQSLPPGADRCASVPDQPADKAGGGTLAASCISLWSTAPLYAQLSDRSQAAVEICGFVWNTESVNESQWQLW